MNKKRGGFKTAGPNILTKERAAADLKKYGAANAKLKQEKIKVENDIKIAKQNAINIIKDARKQASETISSAEKQKDSILVIISQMKDDAENEELRIHELNKSAESRQSKLDQIQEQLSKQTSDHRKDKEATQKLKENLKIIQANISAQSDKIIKQIDKNQERLHRAIEREKSVAILTATQLAATQEHKLTLKKLEVIKDILREDSETLLKKKESIDKKHQSLINIEIKLKRRENSIDDLQSKCLALSMYWKEYEKDLAYKQLEAKYDTKQAKIMMREAKKKQQKIDEIVQSLNKENKDG